MLDHDLAEVLYLTDLEDDHDDHLQVFGPHYTEEALSEPLDLCAAVAAMNKGYIL